MADFNGQNYSYLNMNPGDYVWQRPGQLSQFASQIGNNPVMQRAQAEALRDGPSAWRWLVQKNIQTGEREGLNNAANASAGQEAQANSSLAMRGGLSGGARERIAREGGNNYLNMAQDVSNQANKAGQNADVADEQNRMKALSDQQGVEMQKAGMQLGANQFDINNDINSYDKLNYANLEKYKANMGAWAAGQQANATQNSGKK